MHPRAMGLLSYFQYFTEDNAVLPHCKQVELYGMGETTHTATVNSFG